MKGLVARSYIRRFFGIAALCEGICGPDLYSQVLRDYHVRAHRFECKPCLGSALSCIFFFISHSPLLLKRTFHVHFWGGVRGVFFVSFLFC